MCERVTISSGTFRLGYDETVFQASFSRVGTSWVATAVSRHGVCIRRVASGSKRAPAAVQRACPGMGPGLTVTISAIHLRHGRFVSVSMAAIVNPRWSGPAAGVVCPRADPLPSRGAGDLQQGQGRFVVRQILGDDR